MIEHIKEYTERSRVVHPLSSPKDTGNSPGKRPILKEWQLLKKTPDLKTFPPGCNIGLVCGKASGVTVIDYDNMLFASNQYTGTLMSTRTVGRGHTFFKYDPELKSQKHNMLGIEILNDGSNVVLPPSVHASGDVYKWLDETAQVIEMPKYEKERLINLFNTETEMKQIISKSRTCFKKVLKNYPENIPYFNGSEGRMLMLAICTDLMALGAKEQHLRMFSKLVYREKYDDKRTIEEIKGIAPGKTWRCETLREKLPAYVNCEECVNHKFNNHQNGQTEPERMKVIIPASVKELTLIIER